MENPEEFRQGLSDALKAIPEHDDRKEVLDVVKSTKSYKEAQDAHIETREERVEKAQKKALRKEEKEKSKAFLEKSREIVDFFKNLEGYADSLSPSNLEAFYKKNSESRDVNWRKEDTSELLENSIGGLIYRLKYLLKFFDTVEENNIPKVDVEVLIKEMEEAVSKIEYIKNQNEIVSAEPSLSGVLLYRNGSTLKNREALMSSLKTWLDKLSLLAPNFLVKYWKYKEEFLKGERSWDDLKDDLKKI